MRRTQFSFTSPDNFYYNDSKLMTAVNMAYDLTNREEFTRYDTLGEQSFRTDFCPLSGRRGLVGLRNFGLLRWIHG